MKQLAYVMTCTWSKAMVEHVGGCNMVGNPGLESRVFHLLSCLGIKQVNC